MESLNVRLWNALCELVGTKEEIFIKRRVCHFENIVDNVCHDGNTTLVFSGSKAEGLDLEGSDYDYMFIRKDISVLPPNSANDDSCDIVMETMNVKPGFVRLRCKDGIRHKSDIASALTETNDGLYLSSLLFRDIIVSRYKEIIPNVIAHGPCASFTDERNDEFDLLECLYSKAWPDITSEWIHRQRRNNWPSPTLIKDIIDDGCLLVPIGDPNSEHNFMEWRISFSVPEKKLIYSMNHTQFLCYALLKLYLKHVINSNNEVKDLLCSYFLKTSLFYCMEEENISWTKENLFDCFLVCWRRLIYWVRTGCCPNFFIKANNMFQGKICGEKQRILLSYLSELYHDGVIRLRAVPCLASIFDGTIQLLIPSESICDIGFICSLTLIWFNVSLYRNECFIIMDILTKLQQQTISNVDRAIVTFYLNTTMMICVQWLYRQTLNHRSNKTCYKEIQKLKHNIIQNCMNRDECTAKLLLATVCYLNGEYKEVVTIVEDVLSVHGRYMTMLYNGPIYDDEICGKGLTIHQKLKLGLFCNLFVCHPDCGFYPPEFESEVICHAEDGCILIPTLIYTYLLLFLSHHHLRCKQKVNYTLNELYKAVQSKLYHNRHRPLAISLLEKCLQLAETHQQIYV